jgi:spermidine synthase
MHGLSNPQPPGRAWRRRALVGSAVALPALAALGWTQHERLAALWLRAQGLRVVEERDTPFGRLAVVELDRKRYLAYGPGTQIVYQSVLDLDRPHELAAPYMRLMMLGLLYAGPRAHVALIGLGAGNMAVYALRTFPQARLQAVDIDPHAVELGRRWFGLQPDARLQVHIDDGRRWLQASRERFDVIMLDAYDGPSIPPALADAGFFALVAEHLADGGVVMQNVYRPGVDLPALLAALQPVLPHVDRYRFGDSVVLAAWRGAPRDPQALAAQAARLDAELRPAHPLRALLEWREPAR